MADNKLDKVNDVKSLDAESAIELNAYVVDTTHAINEACDEIDVLTRSMRNLGEAKSRYDLKVKKLRNQYADIAPKL